MDLNKSFKVTKRNVLNELRSNNMTLQELRFFSIYLSKINSKDINTRVVTFPLNDFKKIMDLGRINLAHIKTVTNGLLTKVINVPLERGGYEGFQLFKECRVFQNDLEQWYVEIDAHDKALPLMFSFKEKYFTYELWNALRLTSSNQLRMYELLKQYEKLGGRTISIKDLKDLLGLAPTEYPIWERFKTRVLDKCQEALAENTDITYSYEPIKVGRKFTGVKFEIKKNSKYVDQLTLNEFIALQPDYVVDQAEQSYSNEFFELLGSACNNEFDEEQLGVLNSLMNNVQLFPDQDFTHQGRFLYLQMKYKELEYRAKRTDLSPIKNRFFYLKSLIGE